MNKIPTMVLASETMLVVSRNRPSDLIPFSGDFPLLKPWQEDSFSKDIAGNEFVEGLKDSTQTILFKAKKIVTIEEDFVKYLTSSQKREKFDKMSSKKKTFELLRFLDYSNLTRESLNI